MDDEAFRRRVGENVRKARWLAGLTQEEAATRSRVSYRYYREVETGGRNPSLDLLRAIAEALGVRPSQLVDVESGKPPKRLRDLQAEPPPRGRRPRSGHRAPARSSK